MVPTCPDKVNTVLLVPGHTRMLPPRITPALEAGVTVTVAAAVAAEAQFPLVTTAL